MLEKIKRLFKKNNTDFDDNVGFDVDRKLGKKPRFTVEKKAKDDNVDFDNNVAFNDSVDFDLDKKINKKAKFKVERKAKDDNVAFDDNVEFDLDRKLNKKPKFNDKKKVNNKAGFMDDKDVDFSLDKPSKKKPFKFEFKWWMLIPIVLILAITITVIVLDVEKTTHDKEVSQVAISSLPTKLVYYVGEHPSYTGLTITTTFNDGTEFTEGPEACTFSGFNSEFAVEEQQITVTYKEHTFVYTITIKEPVRPFSPLVKISLETLPKTEYKVGDWLNVNDGVLLLEYEDGSTRRVRLEHKYVYDFSTENPGTFTVTVKLREDGFLATCTYEITVTE